MKVKVRLFANYREIAGLSETGLELEEGATVASARRALEARFPGLDLGGGMAAVNEELARPETPLRDGDELAFLPPVSGGSDDLLELTESPLEDRLSELVRWATAPEYGAVVSFAGTTRSPNKGREVRYLEYEAYSPMAGKTLARIAAGLRQRWRLGRIAIVHRLGRVYPAETSLLIVVSAPHRPEAYEASREALERIKKVLPVWKKEYLNDGEVWVEGAVDEDYRL
ncbi:molybdopterin converting factor subunit 1 [Oceanithermus sp.]